MREPGLTPVQRFLKRTMDLAIAVPGLILTMPIIVIAVAVATVDTREWGIFAQQRIGRYGRLFLVYKVRTMRSNPVLTSTATSRVDPRITRSGRVLRRFKIDELPQLYNVVRGDMSLIGPRPDVRGFADQLMGSDRRVLALRPGITGPATLVYRNEEDLLAAAFDPMRLNREVIWPHKVQLNLSYMDQYSIWTDLRLLAKSVSSTVNSRRSKSLSPPTGSLSQNRGT